MSNKMEIPKWKELDKFLTSRFQSLETVAEIRHSEPTSRKSKSAPEALSNSRNRLQSYSIRLHERGCKYCSGTQLLSSCPKFLSLSPEGRFFVVKRHKLCLNCLTSGHKLGNCKSTFSCLNCKCKHHTLLHRDVSGFFRELRVSNTRNSSFAAYLKGDVDNCFALVSEIDRRPRKNRTLEEPPVVSKISPDGK